MNEEELKEMYKELKRSKKIIGSIDTDFLFEFAETVLNLLEKKDKEILELKKENRELVNQINKLIDEFNKIYPPMTSG